MDLTVKPLGVIVVKAPGRTCLFGDHQDYLGLPVIACAIDRHINLHAVPNKTNNFIINKPDIGVTQIMELYSANEPIERGDHLVSALKILKGYGCVPNRGYSVTIKGNIAINAGTSSSSAVVIAWTQFLLKAFGCNQEVTRELLSQIAYEAEVTFYGAPGGKMDQYSIGLGNIMYMETGDQVSYKIYKKTIPGLIVAESGIPKETTGVLGELKQKAWSAIYGVQQKIPEFTIHKATAKRLPEYLECISDNLKVYLSAAILNHDVTKRALKELRKKDVDFEYIGSLLNEHHAILRDSLKLTVPKIDDIIEGAVKAGALGAKIVGSGRGGSIVVLAREGEESYVIDRLMKAGAKDAYSVNIDPGVRIVEY